MKLPIPKEYYKVIDIRYKGKRVRTYSFGIGKQQILSLPGFPHSGIIYLYLFLKYDLTKVRVVTFDIPGWIGRSENIFEDSIYNEEMLVDVVAEILRAHNFKTFNLIGYSFGTSLAAKLIDSKRFDIHKVALVSPVLNGRAIKDRSKRLILQAAYKMKLFFIANAYVWARFNHYAPTLLRAGMDKAILDEYKAMIEGFDPKVVITSLAHLFDADYSEIIKAFDPHKLLIASSKNESTFLRKQAEHLRKIVDGEKSLILHGNHEDFILKPESDVVKAVVRFLIS